MEGRGLHAEQPIAFWPELFFPKRQDLIPTMLLFPLKSRLLHFSPKTFGKSAS